MTRRGRARRRSAVDLERSPRTHRNSGSCYPLVMTNIAIENDPVEIVDFPIHSMVDLSSSLCNKLPEALLILGRFYDVLSQFAAYFRPIFVRFVPRCLGGSH